MRCQARRCSHTEQLMHRHHSSHTARWRHGVTKQTMHPIQPRTLSQNPRMCMILSTISNERTQTKRERTLKAQPIANENWLRTTWINLLIMASNANCVTCEPGAGYSCRRQSVFVFVLAPACLNTDSPRAHMQDARYMCKIINPNYIPETREEGAPRDLRGGDTLPCLDFFP